MEREIAGNGHLLPFACRRLCGCQPTLVINGSLGVSGSGLPGVEKPIGKSGHAIRIITPAASISGRHSEAARLVPKAFKAVGDQRRLPVFSGTFPAMSNYSF